MPSSYRILPPAPVGDLAAYVRHGGGRGLRRALEVGPDDVVAEIDRSRLRGRGGAGFPTAAKWRGVRATADERGEPCFLVANGAEGEPGSYKDRLLLERSPYAVIEGTLIGSHAIGAEAAIIAVRRSSTASVTRLHDALGEVRAAGWAGADRLSVATGPDDYLFGEASAMLEVLEGRPPLPRTVRPHEAGLFAGLRSANPTVVDNVETLTHVTAVVADGPEPFLRCGTEDSPGTMLFTVTGDVRRPGVWELPLGTTLQDVVDRAGAGDVLAVLGGASGTLVTSDELATPLDFEPMRASGLELGSGGFVVVDGSRCIVQVLATFLRFLAIESCGQCMGCRIGTDTIAGRLARIDRGDGRIADIGAIEARARWLTDGARCRLPDGADRLVRRMLERFRPVLVDHLGRTCPSSNPLPTPVIDALVPGTAVVVDTSYDDGIPPHGRRRGMPR